MPKPFMRLLNVKEKNYAGLADLLYANLKSTNCLALHGGLGAGKTSFARCFIRHHLGDTLADVPSPTFTLAQHYPNSETNALDVWHYDFYRIEDEKEVQELGFDDNMEGAISIIEWPEKITAYLPPDTLFIQFDEAVDDSERNLTFIGTSIWCGLRDKIKDNQELSKFLADE